MIKEIISQSRLYNRYLILLLVILIYQTGSAVKIKAINPIKPNPDQYKHIKIGNNGKYIKRNYHKTYNAMHEFSLQSASLSFIQQQVEFDRQSMAFCAIEKAWKDAEIDSDMHKTIEIGLLRWGWLQGDPVLDNPRPVDWYMVYMESIY